MLNVCFLRYCELYLRDRSPVSNGSACLRQAAGLWREFFSLVLLDFREFSHQTCNVSIQIETASKRIAKLRAMLVNNPKWGIA
jgi:hypothetical protein